APPDPTHWTEHRPGAVAHPGPAAPGTPAPAPATANALPGIAFGAEITAAAQRHHLDPVLLGAMAAQETGGPGAMQGRNIVGDHGHGHGVFQIDDRWHAFASTPAAMDPAQNAEYAAGMLRGLIDRNGGDVRTALHDYNAGSPHRASTTTPWPDGTTLSYEDSVLRHETELRAHLGRGVHDVPAPAAPTPAPAPPQTDYTRPHADRILGETRDGRLVETKAELETKTALLARAERDAREGRIDDVRFVGDGRESAREVARQNEKLWRGVEANLPADGAPPLPPERRDGYTQSGRITSVSEGIVVQDIGRGQTASYAARDFASPPVAGESYTISYRDGVATATEQRAQHQELGRP
ncbi:MAG: transglycosylase SLT domain-containing protein, partial [Candidatus Eremiobacteraeota bacterium]|nr:transglycosylase SLT domain-containing protein [Candidatus Eremiobacteraeota bacterium]